MPQLETLAGESPALLQASAAVSWPAIIAGAFVAAGVSVILLALGSGLGFASISPWADRGVSATTFTITAAIWLLVTQWISAGFGGYLAGRLRSRWVGTHVHEVFFRDTAHGLVTWAVATVLIAASAATSLTSFLGGGAHALSHAAVAGMEHAAPGPMAGPANGLGGMHGSGYDVDKLFRPTPGLAATGSAGLQSATGGRGDIHGANDARMEVAHIVANGVATGTVPEADRTYLSELVAVHTGIGPAEAQKRVDDFIAGVMEIETKVKAEADAARKAAAETSIYLALSLLVGAFIASVSAALGGRLRDEHL